MASKAITSWQIGGETMETVTNLIFLGSKITVDGHRSHEIKRCLLLGRKRLWQTPVQFSHSVLSDSLRPHEHIRFPWPSPTPAARSNSCPQSWWCHPTISSSVMPFSSCLQSSQHQGLFKRVSSSHQVAKVLELQLQHQSFQWIFRTDLL